MFQFSDEMEKNQFEGELTWLFGVLNRENVDKARKNLRIEALNEEEWKRIHTIARSLESVPQVIEETYNNVKEKIRKVGLDEYIDRLTSAKEDLVEWIKGMSLDLKQKLKIGVKFTGRKGIIFSGVLSLVMATLLASPALAERWRLNLGVGYGTYNFSLGKINQFIQDCNSWTEDTFGLSDFKMEKMEETAPIYSLSGRTEIGPLWEVGLDLNYWQAKEITVDKELTIPLEVGSETISVHGDFRAMIVFSELIVCRKFFEKPKSKLSPFVGVGIGSYGASIWGDYSAWDSTHIPPWYWESRNVSESFSVSDFTTGYVLTTGAIWSPVEHFRTSLEAKYHWVPKLTGEFAEEDIYCEGFSSLPMAPEKFKIDPSGLSYSLYLMLRF